MDARVREVGGWVNGKGGSAPDVSATARTDEFGRWSVWVPTGHYTVHLYEPPPRIRSVGAGEFSVAAGESVTHDVSTDRRSMVTGRVERTPEVEGVSIGVERHEVDGEGPVVAWLSYDEHGDGSFLLAGLPAGTYHLTATDPEGRANGLVATGAHSPERFVVRDGVVLTQFDLRVTQ